MCGYNTNTKNLDQLSASYGGIEGSYGDICIVKQRYDFNF